MNIFDWSSLPSELKKIIFNFNRISQDVQIKLELKDLLKLPAKKNHSKILQELDIYFRTNLKSIILYKKLLGSLFYIDIGNDWEDYYRYFLSYGDCYEWQLLSSARKIDLLTIDNICYYCKKNKDTGVIPKYIEWIDNTKEITHESTICLCNDCYNLIEIHEYTNSSVFDGSCLESAIFNNLDGIG